MLNFVKRYRELIAVGALLVFPFVTYLAHAKRGRDLGAIDRAVLWMTAPVERAVTRVAHGVVDVWGDYVALRGVRSEALALRREKLRLEAEVGRLSEAQAENERLRAMIGFAGSAPSPLITAPIVGESPVINLMTLKIGKGMRDGVRKGMAVSAAEGVVGRVHAVGPTASDVLLVSDSNFSLPVRVQRSRARAKVRGMGDRTRPALVQALRTDDVEEGDLLVTAGTDDVFPKGLPVGKVVAVSRPSHGMFLTAEVALAADVQKLEEVFVLMGLPAREELPEAALPRR